ncbi:MAG: phospholipid carrier-dependent glycosyltransferase, partial [Akkermansia sp.]
MKSQDVHKLNEHSATVMMRSLLVFFILGIACFELFIGFRGLFEPAAMDQAQIARNVARGEGMTTNFFRPLQVMDAAQSNGGQIESFDSFGDANHAPLHIYALAGALKMSGYADFDASRMEEGGSSIYEPDRVIAATSMVFFLIALFLSYLVIMRLFDEAVAASTILLMTLSDLWLGYGASGLPQPMMLCFMMAGMYLLMKACDAQSNAKGSKQVALWVAAAFVCIALLCLCSWMAIWVAIALIVFVGTFLRPYGVHALIAALVLIFLLIFPYLRNVGITGSLMA